MSKISHDSETPADGKQVISAVAFIHRSMNNKFEVFLPKRAKTKKFLPDVFEMPGGHIDFGEDIIVGLKREIMEEFGMTVRIGDPFACFTYINKVKGSHSIEVIYFGQFIDELENITINPDDHSEFGWFSRDFLTSNKELMRANAEAASVNTDEDDQDRELNAILKGFDLLEGQNPNTASAVN